MRMHARDEGLQKKPLDHAGFIGKEARKQRRPVLMVL